MSVPPRAVQLNEANAFLKEHPEVLYVDLLIADMNGVVRGKRIERSSQYQNVTLASERDTANATPAGKERVDRNTTHDRGVRTHPCPGSLARFGGVRPMLTWQL